MPNTLLHVFVYGVPAAMAVAGGSVVVQWVRRLSGVVWVRAEVIGHEESEDSDGRVYRSRFEYETDGRRWQVTDEAGFGWRAHQTGHTVWVSVSPADPSRGRVWRVWPAVLGAGLVAAGLGLIASVAVRGLD